VPATQTFPPELEPLEPLAPLDDVLPELPLELGSSSAQNVLRERAHATSPPPHAPSTHAAARYEPPLAQVQHIGLQSANDEQLAPLALLPTTFSGSEGQAPFSCSPLEETFVPDSSADVPELLALPEAPELEEPGSEVVPPLHATSTRAERTPARDHGTKRQAMFFILRRGPVQDAFLPPERQAPHDWSHLRTGEGARCARLARPLALSAPDSRAG
jgi:hypothetical protein